VTKAATPSEVATRSDPLVSFRRDRLAEPHSGHGGSPRSALATQLGCAKVNERPSEAGRGKVGGRC